MRGRADEIRVRGEVGDFRILQQQGRVGELFVGELGVVRQHDGFRAFGYAIVEDVQFRHTLAQARHEVTVPHGVHRADAVPPQVGDERRHRRKDAVKRRRDTHPGQLVDIGCRGL